MPRLYLLSGSDLGKSVDVAHGATFGRSAECTVHLRDVSVSRLHARLELDDGRWTIVDAQSRNGLIVGGERVARAPLADGDEFMLGEVLLRFRADGAPGATTATALPRTAPVSGDVLVSSDAPAASAAPAASGVPRASATPPTSVAPETRAAPPPGKIAAPVPGSDDASVELEGDWSDATMSFPSANPLAQTASVPRDKSLPGASSVSPATSASSAAASRAQANSASSAAASRPPASGASPAAVSRSTATARAPATIDRSRAVLQYQRVAQREGLFNADLAQLPAWVRLGLYALAAAVAAGLFFLAFRGTLFLKERAPGAQPASAAAGDDPND